MDSSRKAAWAAALVLFAISCACVGAAGAARNFQVEAYCSEASVRPFGSYRLVGAPESPAGLATNHAVVADCVRAALANQGMHEAGPGTKAELEITVSFRVEERVEAVTRGMRRFRPVTHRVRTIEVPVTDADGTVRRVPQEIVLPVDEGYVASSSGRRLETRFTKCLEISARTLTDGSAMHAGRELWRVRVSNKDTAGDPDAYARMMVAAAIPFIATETDGRAAVVVNATDPHVLVASARD